MQMADIEKVQEKASIEKSDTGHRSTDETLSLSVRQDPESFRQSLLTINETGKNKAQTMSAFDKPTGSPEIIDLARVETSKRLDRQKNLEPRAKQETKSANTVTRDGQVVRERSANGNDTVIAYDNAGKAHRFEDTKITSLPVDFKNIPEWRREQLRQGADSLIKNYKDGKTPNGKTDGKISFNDLANMMKDVGKMDDLTEVEKARLWSDVRVSLQKNSVSILDADEKPEMIDSWKGSDDPWHAVITMDDGYHGNRLINMPEKDASQAIHNHENGAEADKMPFLRSLVWRGAKAVLGVNKGDINASEGTLRALRAYRDKGTFSAYAEQWQKEFVRPDIDQYGKPRH